MRRRPFALTMAGAFFAVACGSGGSGDGGSDTGVGGTAGIEIEADACDHFEYGPELAVTATTDGAGAPEAETHHDLTVTLPGADTAHSGVLSVTTAEATEMVFLFDTDVTVTLTGADGQIVAPAITERPGKTCDTAKLVIQANLPAGTSQLAIGPTDAASVRLVIHPAVDDDAGDAGDAGVESVPAEYAALVNPLPSDAAALAAGASVYGANCASCHGETGAGDGPIAGSQTPPPTHFQTDAALAGRTDGYLFWKVSEGTGTMPGFKSSLSETERWQVIDFVRSL